MIITRHRYTVRPEYVAQNRQNLDEFVAALTAASVPGLSYRVFLEEDGQTFLHLVTSQDHPSAVVTGLPSFKKFQSELLASAPPRNPTRSACRSWRRAESRTGFSLLTGDRLRRPGTLFLSTSRRDETHVQ